MTKILIKAEGVKDDVLEEMIRSLENATDCAIAWRQVYVLESESTKALKILHSPFGGEVEEGEIVSRKEKTLKKPRAKGGKSGRVVSNKWTVLTGLHAGEVLITQRVNKMCARGELHAGEKLSHPKLGVRFVSNGKLIEEPAIHPVEVTA